MPQTCNDCSGPWGWILSLSVCCHMALRHLVLRSTAPLTICAILPCDVTQVSLSLAILFTASSEDWPLLVAHYNQHSWTPAQLSGSELALKLWARVQRFHRTSLLMPVTLNSSLNLENPYALFQTHLSGYFSLNFPNLFPQNKEPPSYHS